MPAASLLCLSSLSKRILTVSQLLGIHPPLSSTGTVISEILSFNGPEFYIQSWPELTRRKHRSFRSVLFSFDGAIPVGIKRGDGYVTISGLSTRSQQPRPSRAQTHLSLSVISLARPGSVRLNPPDSFQLEEGDEVIALAEDDDAYSLLPRPEVPGNGQMPPYIEVARASERILFLNWRRDMDDMIMELDTQVGKVSVLFPFCLRLWTKLELVAALSPHTTAKMVLFPPGKRALHAQWEIKRRARMGPS